MPKKIIVSIAAMMVLAGLASAQAPASSANSQAVQAAAPAGPIPRMPDGHPNLAGMWFTRPWQAAQANGGFFSNLVQNGELQSSATVTGGRGNGANARTNRPHYLPAADAIRQELGQHYLFEDPEGLCQLPGVPRAFYTPPYPYQFIQDEKYLTMLLEYVEDSRIIPISNAPHLKNYWSWNGDSRAHWEGDTLVVDVTDFNGRAWLDTLGDFFDENLHVVEKYTMKDHDTIDYEITANDPTILAEPWVNHRTFYRQPDTEQILEYSCKEGERSIQHYTDDLGGTQKTELKRPTQ